MKSFAFGRGLTAGILVVSLCAGCAKKEHEPDTLNFTGMGTIGSLILPHDAAPRAPALVQAVSSLVSNLEVRLSVFNPQSDLSRLNASAGTGSVEVSTDTRAVLEMALQVGEESGGAFDVTVGPLMALWGFRGGLTAPHIPTDMEKEEALRKVGYHHLVMTGRLARLDQPGVRLDAGGIGKGYAVDRCWDRLRQGGEDRFLMNLGGNMRACGQPTPERKWTVGVRHPFKEGSILGKIKLPSGLAVATSGHYERFVMRDGVRYSHIMDPRTGSPVRGMAGVTVVAPTAVEADVMSTTLFVMGSEAGLAMLAKTGRQVEALFVPDRQPVEIRMTPGMASLFEPVHGVATTILK